MADRPIVFSAPMIRALLDGRKTQTRRVLKPQPYEFDGRWWVVDRHSGDCHLDMWARGDVGCRPYFPGDRLWVRETFAFDDDGHEEWPLYRADGATLPTLHPNRKPARWRPSIHMPRWASRLTLIVTGVRVQRVQDISEEDAVAEGAERLAMDDDGKFYQHDAGTHRTGFAGLWEHLNGPRGFGWDANPWVVALTFTAHRCNIDQMEAA